MKVRNIVYLGNILNDVDRLRTDQMSFAQFNMSCYLLFHMRASLKLETLVASLTQMCQDILRMWGSSDKGFAG